MINLKEENREIIRVMAVENSKSYNFNKALEECTEFAEVILKLQTKSSSNPKKPHLKEATKEFGDTVFRGLVALQTLNPDKSIDEILQDTSDHIDYKLSNLMRYYSENLYEGGI
jgi:hypothetical protein